MLQKKNILVTASHVMDMTYCATLEEVTKPTVLEALTHIIAAGGSLFIHNNNYFVLPTTKENVRIAAQRSEVILTKDKTSNHIIACSFSSAISAEVGMRVDLYFYSNHNDYNIYFTHLHKTLKRLPSVVGERSGIGLQLHIPLSLDSERIQSHMKDTLHLGERIRTAPFEDDRGVAYLYKVLRHSSL